jgi:NADPH:quinone reductase-like Zn-dependent oxidoreductase
MKTISLEKTGGPEVLQVMERPDPVPASNEVLVRLYAAGVNHLDLWVRGGSPAYPVPLPHTPGSDGAGVVEKVGDAVEGVAEGDRVMIFPGLSCGECVNCRKGLDNQCVQFQILGAKKSGTYAEKVAVPDENVIVIPDSLSFEEAASFGVAYGTAWHMVVGRAQLKPKETVLVVGAGSGVSLAAIRIAKNIGAKVLASTTKEEKMAAIKSTGADEVFLLSEGKDLTSWTKEHTGGQGVEVVVEHVGPATWESSLKSLAPYGRLVTCGATTGPTVNLDLRFLFSRNLTLLGARMSTKREFQQLTSEIFSGRIKPKIDRVYPLEEAFKAHERLESRHQIGKIVLKID